MDSKKEVDDQGHQEPIEDAGLKEKKPEEKKPPVISPEVLLKGRLQSLDMQERIIEQQCSRAVEKVYLSFGCAPDITTTIHAGIIEQTLKSKFKGRNG